MTSSTEALLFEAKNLEMQGLEKHKVALASASSLDEMLKEVYDSLSPKPIDYDNRRDLVRIFNVMAKEIYGNCNGFPNVEVFGSSVMGMFNAESDLDLSINFSNNGAKITRVKKVKALRKLARKFHSIGREGHVTDIQKILTARVPIVKVIDQGTRIECDVSVENRDGIVKSLIIRAISTIDERFLKLSFLVKAWAKAHDINSSKDQTLNSLSLILLVAFHLQTRDPPILPTFSALFKDGNDPEAVVKMVQNYLNYGIRNKESLAELFITLLVKLASVEQLWQKGLCVSLCEGFWISKTWDSGFYNIHVEDFIDQSQNVARAVGTLGFEKIHSSIHRSLHYLEAFSEGQMLGTKLKELLFDRDTKSSVGDSVALNLDISTTKLSVPNSSNQINKIQLTEDVKGANNQSKRQLVVQYGSQQTKKRHFTGLDETKGVKRWKGHLGDKRVGVQFMEVIEEHLKPIPSIRWEGKEPEAKRRERKKFGENRGNLSTHFVPQPQNSIHLPHRGHLSTHFVPQPQNGIHLPHSLVSSTSRGPVMPPISVPNFPSFQGLCNPVAPSVPPPPPSGRLFSLLNSLGVDISHIQSTPAPILPSGPTHGQPTQHQQHSMQRILRR